MTNEKDCGCRLPCGVCMVTNRMCPIMQTINDVVYSTDDCVGGVHLVDREYLRRDEKVSETVKAKLNELYGKGKMTK